MHVRNAERWIVRRNKEVVRDIQPLRIEESSGGKRMDFAELMFDPRRKGKMEDYSPLDDLGAEIEIEAIKGGIKHIGIVAQVIPIFGPQGEVFKIVSQTLTHLFGDQLSGVFMNNPLGGRYNNTHGGVYVRGDVVFNPEVDGKIFGNMDSSRNDGPGNSHVFIDPMATLAEATRKLYGGRAIMWTISKAVHFLCCTLNEREEYFRNPTIRDLEKFSFTDSLDHVRNVQVSCDSRLPEALDALIGPLGYSWRLQVERGRRNLAFYKRGTGGRLRWLKHQRHGESFDPLKTNVETQGVVFDAGRLTNRIFAWGSKKQYELTMELVRAWNPKFDEWARDDLKNTEITDEVKRENPGIEHAWRRWAVNESGKYIGLRPEIKEVFAAGVATELNDRGWLRGFTPRPRKLLPTLTLNDDGEPIGTTKGVDVEWSDDGGESWYPIGKWSVDLLDQEAGVFIGSNEIPEELFDAGSLARMRVTATLESDESLAVGTDKNDRSPLEKEVTASLDLEARYHHRQVSTTSKYAFSKRPTLEVFDEDAMQAFVDELTDRFDNVDVAGAVALEGVDQHDYRLGDRIAGIKGKNISFRSRRDGTTYPQIAAITYDIEGQKTILHMSRVRETVII